MAPQQYRRASYCANESRSNPEMGRRQANLRRRPKLGLAVCITMSESFEEEMELFCSEHIALLESMLSRLRASTERAYINHKYFLQVSRAEREKNHTTESYKEITFPFVDHVRGLAGGTAVVQ